MPTISQQLTELVDQKNQLAENLTTMGVTATSSETLNTLVPKVLQIPQTAKSSTVIYDAKTHTEYLSTLFIQYNSTIYSLIEFIQSHAAFCSEANKYALYYTYEVFGWDYSAYTCSLTPVNITSESKISIKYKSSSSETGIFRLVQSDTGTPDDIIEKAQTDGSYVDLSFQWLTSSTYVENLISCEDVTPGTYYIVWVGRSNNSHPFIYNITVL